MSEVTGRYTLIKPISRKTRVAGSDEVKEELITEIVVRPMTPGDLLVTDKVDGPAAKSLALMAHLTGLTLNEVKTMPSMADFAAISKIVEGFSEPGHPTGETPSAS
jgi:hypothetical protein